MRVQRVFMPGSEVEYRAWITLTPTAPAERPPPTALRKVTNPEMIWHGLTVHSTVWERRQRVQQTIATGSAAPLSDWPSGFATGHLLSGADT